jgi:hypothetical protein
MQPTAAPLNQCQGKGMFSEVDEVLYDRFQSVQRVREPNRTREAYPPNASAARMSY